MPAYTMTEINEMKKETAYYRAGIIIGYPRVTF